MKKEKMSILELIFQIISTTGNPYLENIFQRYYNNEEELCDALRDYIRGIYTEINEGEEDDEEGGEKKNIVVNRFIYLNGVVLDATNISRIELDEEYNPIKNINKYFIRIVKKYPSPLEEEFIILFSSEEERDYGYEVLKGKLKLLNINII